MMTKSSAAVKSFCEEQVMRATESQRVGPQSGLVAIWTGSKPHHRINHSLTQFQPTDRSILSLRTQCWFHLVVAQWERKLPWQIFSENQQVLKKKRIRFRPEGSLPRECPAGRGSRWAEAVWGHAWGLQTLQDIVWASGWGPTQLGSSRVKSYRNRIWCSWAADRFINVDRAWQDGPIKRQYSYNYSSISESV